MRSESDERKELRVGVKESELRDKPSVCRAILTCFLNSTAFFSISVFRGLFLFGFRPPLPPPPVSPMLFLGLESIFVSDFLGDFNMSKVDFALGIPNARGLAGREEETAFGDIEIFPSKGALEE